MSKKDYWEKNLAKVFENYPQRFSEHGEATDDEKIEAFIDYANLAKAMTYTDHFQDYNRANGIKEDDNFYRGYRDGIYTALSMNEPQEEDESEAWKK